MPSRFVVLLVALVALASATVGAVLGARESDEADRAALPERAGRPLEQTSFLAKIVPVRRRGAAAPGGPPTARDVADLVRRLPVERKVAQLFLVGFRGTDASAEIFRRLARLDLGGLVLARQNYADPAQLTALTGEAAAIARRRGHVPPWVLAVQDGAEFNDLPGLPPASVPADLRSAEEARAEASETADDAARPRRERRARSGGRRGVRVGLGTGRARVLGRARRGGRLRRRRGPRLPRQAPVRRRQALPRARRRRPVDASSAPRASGSTSTRCATAT